MIIVSRKDDEIGLSRPLRRMNAQLSRLVVDPSVRLIFPSPLTSPDPFLNYLLTGAVGEPLQRYY